MENNDISSSIPSPDSVPEAPEYELNARQMKLVEVLKAKDESLSNMFEGALDTLNNTRNPEHLPQAAHSIRELMEKLPRYIDVQTSNKFDIKNRVNQLIQYWEKIKGTCDNIIANELDNVEIDDKFRKFLNKVDTFFTDYNQHSPSKRKETADTLSTIDLSEIGLPESLMSLDCKKWLEFNMFFQGISHHGRKTTDEVFNQWLDAFERFLVERMVPQTFDSFDQLDELIAEGEK